MTEIYMHHTILKAPTTLVIPVSPWKRNIEHIYKCVSQPTLLKGEFVVPYNDQMAPAMWLFLQACSMVTPPCLDHTQCRRKDDTMHLTLRAPHEAMPVDHIKTEVERLRHHLLLYFEAMKAEDASTVYSVRNHTNMPLNVVEFANKFTPIGVTLQSFYPLPEGVSFTDSTGEEHTGLAPREAMIEYLKTHTFPGLKNNDIENMSPAAVTIDRAQLDRIVAALDLNIKKGVGLLGQEAQGRA